MTPPARSPSPRYAPTPELARYDQIHAERAEVPAPVTPPAPPAPAATALGVLSAVLDHDGQQLSAIQTCSRRQAASVLKFGDYAEA